MEIFISPNISPKKNTYCKKYNDHDFIFSSVNVFDRFFF